MIVRISGEGQFDLNDDHRERLNVLDDETVDVVDSGDENGFQQHYDALLEFVRKHGRLLATDELHESNVILPPADLSFAEATSIFTGEGLIPNID